MINFDYIIKENIKKHNPNWSQILNHPYKKIIFLIFFEINTELDALDLVKQMHYSIY